MRTVKGSGVTNYIYVYNTATAAFSALTVGLNAPSEQSIAFIRIRLMTG